MILKVRSFYCVYFPKIYHRKTRLDIMVLMMNYKYDNPQSLIRVILCQINRFENKPLREDILYFSYLFFVLLDYNIPSSFTHAYYPYAPCTHCVPHHPNLVSFLFSPSLYSLFLIRRIFHLLVSSLFLLSYDCSYILLCNWVVHVEIKMWLLTSYIVCSLVAVSKTSYST